MDIKMGYCKLCNKKLDKKPDLILKNMPYSAQNFLDEKGLSLDKAIELKIYECKYCGLVQLDAKPVYYYKDVIRAVAYSPAMKKFRLNQFKEFVERFDLSDKRIIEIGSGKGEYLELMNRYVKRCYGLENNERSVNIANNKGLKVFKGYLENHFLIENAPYDAFFIMSYLEHIPNLNDFFETLHMNLKSDAIGLIEVPNYDMIIKKRLFSEFILDHLYYFTKKTLKLLLNVNGFEVIEIKSIWHDYIISAIVKKRKNPDFSLFIESIDILKKQMRESLNKYKKIVVWGAGHQSLALISLLDLKDKIKFVVDSAKFKQNLYTPATHLKIKSPEELCKYKPEAVIVIAGSYNNEVVEIIKKMGIKADVYKIENNLLYKE